MLDIQFIRDNPDLVQEKSKQKGYEVDIQQLLGFDKKRRGLQQELEKLQHDQNQAGIAFKEGPPGESDRAAFRHQRELIKDLEHQLNAISQEFTVLLKQVPNMPLDDVPVGKSEKDNQVVKTVGEPTKFSFKPNTDAELGLQHDVIDKERAAKVAGSRFAYLKGDLVKLQFALIQFVIDKLADEDLLKEIIEKNNLKISNKQFMPILPPPMVATEVYDRTARLNGEEQTYKLADDELWLNASAEHSLAPMYMDEILAEENLPIRYLGYATSFRREAGSYGKDMEGIFRLHHFDKLEMVAFSTPETSLDEHLFMIAIQEYLMQELQLSYQVILKCTADIGAPNARGVDINVWMPGQAEYRESHTADLITDYQARRLKTRLRRANGDIELVHNNDATAFALGRILKAIMENYQQKDGTIQVPDVLKPYTKRGY